MQKVSLTFYYTTDKLVFPFISSFCDFLFLNYFCVIMGVMEGEGEDDRALQKLHI